MSQQAAQETKLAAAKQELQAAEQKLQAAMQERQAAKQELQAAEASKNESLIASASAILSSTTDGVVTAQKAVTYWSNLLYSSAGSSRSPSELLALTCPSSTLANLNPANDASGQLIRLSVCNPHPQDGSPPILADGCLMLLDQGSEVDVFLPAYEAWKLKLKPNLFLKPEHVDTVTGSVLVIYFEQILITLKLQDKDGGNVERSIMATPATPVLAYTEFKANAASSSVAHSHSTQPQHQPASSSSSSSPSTTSSTLSSSFLTPVKSTQTSDTSSSQDSVTYPLTSVSPLKHEKDGNQEHFVILGLPAIQRLSLVMDVSAKKVYMAKKRRLRIL